MPRLSLSVVTLILFPLYCLATAGHGTVHAISRSRYSRAHSLGDTYIFDSQDGWQSANVTNLQYKYKRQELDTFLGLDDAQLEKRGRGTPKPAGKPGPKDDGLGAIKHVVEDIWNGLKGVGNYQDATITW
jgi:hypothetical protein